MMRKKGKKKALFIFVIIIASVVTFILGYFGTLYLDNLRKGGELNVNVTYEDSKTYTIPNVLKLTKEDALKEWPYIIHLENTSDTKGLYQIKIQEEEKTTIKRDELEYLIKINDQDKINGKLKDIKGDILYTGEINNKEKQELKVFIWSDIDNKKEDIYEYKLDFNIIKAGGPGF